MIVAPKWAKKESVHNIGIHQYVREFCRPISRKFPVLQLALTYPVSGVIRSFITKHAPTKIIICEELGLILKTL